jgi:hypothetical protein
MVRRLTGRTRALGNRGDIVGVLEVWEAAQVRRSTWEEGPWNGLAGKHR